MFTTIKKIYLSLLLFPFIVACNDIEVNKTASQKAQANLYFNGEIITMEGDNPTYAEVVVEQNGKIVYVGARDKIPSNLTNEINKIDLQGKTMLPGFIEPHLHPSIAAILLSGDVVAPHDWSLPSGVKKGVSGHDAYIKRIKDSVKKYASDLNVLFIWGYHQLWHGDLSKEILNKVSPDKAVAVIHRSFHEIFLNDKAIELMKVKKQDFANQPQVEWSKGHFFEGGWLALVPKISPQLLAEKRYKMGLAEMTKIVKKNGITTIAEPGFPNSNFDMEYNLLLSEMNKKPPYDIFNIFSGTQLNIIQGSNNKAFQFIDGAKQQYDTNNVTMLPKQVKLFSDGAIYSLAMEMKEGYSDGFQGQWMTPLGVFEEQMDMYWKNGYKIHIHANGDLGIQRCLDILDKLMKEYPRKDHRLTLHHLGYFTADQADMMKRLGVEASVNPYYLWALADKYSLHGLGKKRAENLVSIKLLQDRGIPYSLHSDFGMAPLEPLTLAWVAVNRVTSENTRMSQDQRVDAFHAIKGITLNAARTLEQENSIGSIKEGKIANFTLLAENPFKVDPMHIKDIQIAGTVYQGEMFLNSDN